MDWFKRKKETLKPSEKKELPDGLWVKCDNCGEIIYKKELEKKYYVCPKCDYHFRIGYDIYVSILFDEGTFEEFNRNIKSTDPLSFKDSKKYSDKYKATVKKTGLNEAVVTGVGRIEKHQVVMALMDFRFLGGSMGSVVGEKISRAIDKAIELKCPLIILSSSGGARMHEGILSLMQLAKTSAKLARLSQRGLPYISLLTNPTTGGTTASYAMLGDIIIAEPKAMVGFAGPRVIEKTIGKKLPEGFQRAEFLLEHGMIDMIVERKDQRETLGKILALLESG